MTGVFSIKADEVEFLVAKAPFTYPRRGEDDPLRGFGHVAVIPSLFDWVVLHRHFPSPAVGMAFIMEQLCDPACREQPGVRRRGEKLYFDFARDMHAYGLLCQCDLF